jgi:UDP-N-acetylmuramoylalanine--D-glutamate ligase
MRVVVVGAARTGISVAKFCAARGDEVVVNDKTEAIRAFQLPTGVKLELGGHPRALFESADLIVISPGVPTDLPELDAARKKGVEVIGEIELAAQQVTGPIVAITGTNGKSTTTALCGEICGGFTGGNLGTPFIEAAGTKEISVVEVSSFQLETIVTFRPKVAVLLNITPDHLDRYRGMAEYVAAKRRIFENQTPDDFAIVNAADPVALECAAGTRAKTYRFTSTSKTDQGAFLDGGDIVLRIDREERYPLAELPLVGRHNAENAMAAFLAARLAGISSERVRETAKHFRALPHRMELVGESAAGVRYYDDSKGTNVGAVAASLDGFPRPYILIAGGKHKGGSYAPLRKVLKSARALVLIGEAAPLMYDELHDVVDTHRAATLEEAVDKSAQLAKAGDAVVLSPACSSFDMFRNYEHRSEVFRAAVRKVTT